MAAVQIVQRSLSILTEHFIAIDVDRCARFIRKRAPVDGSTRLHVEAAKRAPAAPAAASSEDFSATVFANRFGLMLR